MSYRLPTELWRRVLRHSTEEPYSPDQSALADYAHPCRQVPPDDDEHRLLVRTKLAIILVCSKWHSIATEFLWGTISHPNQSQLVQIVNLLLADHSDPSISVKRGWWIRSLHTRFDFGDNIQTFTDTLCLLLRYCPNLRIFSHIHDFNGPLPSPVVRAFTSHCSSSLVRFQLNWGGVDIDDMNDLLYRCHHLEHLSLGCTFAPPPLTRLPSSSPHPPPHPLSSSNLRSLHFGNSEDGMIRKFNCHLLEAALWKLPSLTTVSIDVDCRTSVEELVGFLQSHGNQLISLTLTDSGPRVDGLTLSWNQIFGLCPNLKQLKLSYNPFLQHALTGRLTPLISVPGANSPSGNDSGDDNNNHSDGEEHYVASPSHPPIAGRLERFCFARWEFMGFSESSPLVAQTDDAATSGNEDPETEIAPREMNSLPSSSSTSTTSTTASSSPDIRTSAYLKHVLDIEFEAIGGNLTPNLRFLEFDFNAERVDLPDSCMEWWKNWIREWTTKRGLTVRGRRGEVLSVI